MKYPRKMPEILQYISQGFSQKEAYEKAGVSQTQFYKWMAENTEFADMVHKAQDDYRSSRADIEAVERALVESAKGYEVEDVKTEYISRQDPATGKYVPVISKQVRTAKKVAPNVEAAKFLLTNRDPDRWKNRVEQHNTGDGLNGIIKLKYIGDKGEEVFPSSEDEVDDVRET